MNITKETFLEFLKENDFYKGWMEGYNLDNKIMDDVIPLDKFFKNTPAYLWLYSGPGCLPMLSLCPDNINFSLKKRYDEWREKYMEKYRDLDEKWMRFVEENKQDS